MSVETKILQEYKDSVNRIVAMEIWTFDINTMDKPIKQWILERHKKQNNEWVLIRKQEFKNKGGVLYRFNNEQERV